MRVVNNLVGWGCRSATAEWNTFVIKLSTASSHTRFSVIKEPSGAFSTDFMWGETMTLLTVWDGLSGKALADAPLIHTRHAHRNKVMLLSRTYGRALGRWLWRSTKKRQIRSESLKHQFVCCSFFLNTISSFKISGLGWGNKNVKCLGIQLIYLEGSNDGSFQKKNHF